MKYEDVKVGQLVEYPIVKGGTKMAVIFKNSSTGKIFCVEPGKADYTKQGMPVYLKDDIVHTAYASQLKFISETMLELDHKIIINSQEEYDLISQKNSLIFYNTTATGFPIYALKDNSAYYNFKDKSQYDIADLIQLKIINNEIVPSDEGTGFIRIGNDTITTDQL